MIEQIHKELNPENPAARKESLLDKLKSSESSSNLFQHPNDSYESGVHRSSSTQFRTLMPMKKMPSRLQATCTTAQVDASLAFEHLLLEIDNKDFKYVPLTQE